MVPVTGVRHDPLEAIDPALRAEIDTLFECAQLLPLADGAWVLEARATGLGGREVLVHLFDREVLRAHEAERSLDDGYTAWRALVHPNAVTPLRVGGGAASRWVATPITHGVDLAESLRRNGPMLLDDALRLTEQLASALHEAHQRGAAHGAVRPEHVQLDDRGWTTLLGCGVAHVVDRLAGRAPSSLTAADDQADLARLLLCCLVGIPEWSNDDRVSVAVVPAATLAVIRQALSARPAARYADVLEFIGALRSSQWSAAPASPLVRPQPLLLVGPPLGASRHRALTGVAVAVGLAMLATLAMPSNAPVVSLAVARAPVEPAPQETRPAATASSAALPAVERSPAALEVRDSSPTLPVPVVVEPRPTPPVRPRVTRTAAKAPARRPPVALASAPSGDGGSPPTVVAPPPIDLDAQRPRLSVSARPWGDIYIDGRAMGPTPKAQLPLDPGPRRIRIVRPGFGIYDTLVVVRVGEHVRLIDVMLPTVRP
jgi:hypothetical protein